MNKKFQKLFFAGALLVGLAGMSVSCKDYDDDINALGERVTVLEKTVDGLDAAVKAGAILDKVEKTADGIAVTVTKNGKTETFQITNGKDGAKGDKGDQGIQGPVGPQGPQGEKGEDGKDGENGKDGKDGVNGQDGKPGTVITAGEDGFWYIDNVKSDKPWKGEKGENGKNGENGKDGVDGEDGLNGLTVYYKPGKVAADAPEGTIPTWVKVTVDTNVDPAKVTEEVTDEPVFPAGTLTAVFNPETQELTIYNAKGTDKPVKIGLAQELTGVVTLTPDFYGGIPAFTMSYKDIISSYASQSNKDSKDELAVLSNAKFYVHNRTALKFNTNPSNAVVSKEAKNYTFTVVDGIYEGRSASKFGLKTVAVVAENGELTVEAVPAANNILPLLPSSNENGTDKEPITTAKINAFTENVKVVSDEFTFLKDAVAGSTRIVCPEALKGELNEIVVKNLNCNRDVQPEAVAAQPETEKDYIYRSSIDNKISEIDPVAYNKAITWQEEYVAGVDPRANVDVLVPFGTDFDLNKIVALRFNNNDGTKELLSAQQLADNNLKFTYSLVKNYKYVVAGAEKAADQNANIKLEGSILNASEAALGQTPIIRVEVAPLTYAYIKVGIFDPKATQEVEYNFDADETLEFACGISAQFDSQFNEKWVKENVLSVIVNGNMETFLNNFEIDEEESVIPAGKVFWAVDEAQKISSLFVDLTEEDIWNLTNAKPFNEKVEYKVVMKDPCTLGFGFSTIKVNFSFKVKEFNNVRNIAVADMIEDYWNPEYTHGKFNINVPNVGETDDAKCLYKGELNDLFVKQQKPAIEGLNELNYAFDREALKALKGHTYAESTYNVVKNVEYSVSVRNEETQLLIAKADGFVNTLVAELDIKSGHINIIKASDLARALVNTAEWSLPIRMEGTMCESEHEMNITVNGKENFWVDIVRPIKVETNPTEGFIDGVDFGAEGSYILYEDVVDPIDWRDYKFADHKNYWSYYGPFSIAIEVASAEANIDGDEFKNIDEFYPQIELEEAGTSINGGKVTDKYGILTYKNNGIVVNNDFQIKVPVAVNYGWGTIKQIITIDVEKTIIADK